MIRFHNFNSYFLDRFSIPISVGTSFEVFKNSIQNIKITSIDLDKKNKFISLGTGLFEKYFDVLNKDYDAKNQYSFLLDVDDLIKQLEIKSREKEEEFNKFKENEINKLFVLFPAENYHENEYIQLKLLLNNVTANIQNSKNKNKIIKLIDEFKIEANKIKSKKYYNDDKINMQSYIEKISAHFSKINLDDYYEFEQTKLSIIKLKYCHSIKDSKKEDREQIFCDYKNEIYSINTKKDIKEERRKSNLKKCEKIVFILKILCAPLSLIHFLYNYWDKKRTKLDSFFFANVFIYIFAGITLIFAFLTKYTDLEIFNFLFLIFSCLTLFGSLSLNFENIFDFSFVVTWHPYIVHNVISNVIGGCISVFMLRCSFLTPFNNILIFSIYNFLQIVFNIVGSIKNKYYSISFFLACIFPLLLGVTDLLFLTNNLVSNIFILVITFILMLISLIICFKDKEQDARKCTLAIPYSINIFFIMTSIIDGHFFDFHSLDIFYWLRFDIITIMFTILFFKIINIKDNFKIYKIDLLRFIYYLRIIILLIIIIINPIAFINAFNDNLIVFAIYSIISSILLGINVYSFTRI